MVEAQDKRPWMAGRFGRWIEKSKYGTEDKDAIEEMKKNPPSNLDLWELVVQKKGPKPAIPFVFSWTITALTVTYYVALFRTWRRSLKAQESLKELANTISQFAGKAAPSKPIASPRILRWQGSKGWSWHNGTFKRSQMKREDHSLQMLQRKYMQDLGMERASTPQSNLSKLVYGKRGREWSEAYRARFAELKGAKASLKHAPDMNKPSQ